MIVLARDTGEGHITLDRQGDPILHYWPNETDRRHLVRGMQEQARIAFAGGATRVAMLHTPTLILEAEGGQPGAVTEQKLNAYLREIEHRGIAPNQPMLFSAHQMGTARMGADAEDLGHGPVGRGPWRARPLRRGWEPSADGGGRQPDALDLRAGVSRRAGDQSAWLV